MDHASPCSCPACGNTMERARLARNYVGEVELDLCFSCQGLWFDTSENLQLAPRSVVELFRRIHAHRNQPCRPLPASFACPRCRSALQPRGDVVRWGRFRFSECPAGHGRFITFAQFLVEKGFVRPLGQREIAALGERIGAVRCTGCGAAVDIRKDDACTHCGAPISALDPDAVSKALQGYTAAEKRLAGTHTPAVLDAAVSSRRTPAISAADHAATGSEVADLVLSGIGLIVDILSS